MATLKVRDLTCCGTPLYTPGVEVFLHSVIFLGLNVLVNYFSKLYLSARNVHTVFGDGLGYEFPLFDSVTDCSFCTIALLLLMWIFPSLRQVSVGQFLEYKFTLFFLMVFHVSSIVLNNLSLVWLGLSINQIIKGASPLPTMFFTYLLLGTRYSWAVVITVFLLTTGCVIAVPPTEFHTSSEGIIVAIVAMLCLSVKQVIYEMLLSNSSISGLNPFAITFWQFALGAPFLTILWGLNVNDERAPVVQYWHDYPHTALWISLLSALLALLYNLSTLSLTKVTSALTLNIVSSIKFILVIIIPGVIEHVFVPYNWVGVGLYLFFLCIYTYLKIPREVKEYEEALKLDDEEGDRFFLQPGGKYILKQQRTGFMYVYGGSYVSYPTVPAMMRVGEDKEELWGHHLTQRDEDLLNSKGCFDCLCCPADEPLPPMGNRNLHVNP